MSKKYMKMAVEKCSFLANYGSHRRFRLQGEFVIKLYLV